VAIAALPSSALAQLHASATISTGSTSAPYSYTITLNNTGTTDINSFWFAWTDTPAFYDFLPSSPTVTNLPTGWTAPITNTGPGDGYGIEFYNPVYNPGGTGSPIAPGGSGTFAFTTPDSPLTLNGDAYIPPNKITTSWVYMGIPTTDPGFSFNMTVVSQLPGDANFDGIVNGLDIALVSSNWLQTGNGDANGDGVVNGLDIALVSANWLRTAAAGGTAVPEPPAMVLAALAGVALLLSYAAKCGLPGRVGLRVR
jgi:hypothetical protein